MAFMPSDCTFCGKPGAMTSPPAPHPPEDRYHGDCWAHKAAGKKDIAQVEAEAAENAKDEPATAPIADPERTVSIKPKK